MPSKSRDILSSFSEEPENGNLTHWDTGSPFSCSELLKFTNTFIQYGYIQKEYEEKTPNSVFKKIICTFWSLKSSEKSVAKWLKKLQQKTIGRTW